MSFGDGDGPERLKPALKKGPLNAALKRCSTVFLPRAASKVPKSDGIPLLAAAHLHFAGRSQRWAESFYRRGSSF